MWHGIHGHDQVVEQFRRGLVYERLASSFLFIGPAGVGKRTFALKLAQALLCETHAGQQLDPCGRCPACQQVAAGSHPDLVLVGKPKDKSFIPVETFIGDREHRMQEGLCHNISLKPFCGGRKIAIIDDADYLNQEGANCLLKTLEEPPPKSLIILIGTSEQKQLPTIRSRCQIIRFRPLADEIVAELLVAHQLVADQNEAAPLAALAQGSLERALELADSQLREFRERLLEQLSDADLNLLDFAKAVSSFVDEAGKEAPPRRARMKQLMGFAAEFYRQLMRTLSGLPVAGDSALERAVIAAARWWPSDEETAADCLQRCLDAQSQVESNANQATLLECWFDDLAELSRGGQVAAA
jgi:DNA polymerase-3 subunit delta'